MLIKRTDSSTYFPKDLFEREKRLIESFSLLSYFSPLDPLPDEGEIILITNTHTRLEKWEHIESRVKLIIHPNSGFENLNTKKWKAPVVIGNSIRAQAVAEWSLSVLYQEIGPVSHHPIWPVHRFNPRRLTSELNTLIVGFGHVGKILKTYLPQAQVFDPWLDHHIDLKQKWDVVILAASSNPANQGIINENFLSHCSDDLLLINPARGELVSKIDLETFLSTHPQARAYMDVHESEPYPENFYPSNQIVATPHIAGVWDGLIEEMLAFEIQVLKGFDNNSIPKEWFLESRLTPQGFYR